MSEIISIGWFVGLGVMFGLSLVMTYMTYQDLETFFIWLNIFTGFIVWSGLLPLWVLILTLISVSAIIIVKLRKGGNL